MAELFTEEVEEASNTLFDEMEQMLRGLGDLADIDPSYISPADYEEMKRAERIKIDLLPEDSQAIRLYAGRLFLSVLSFHEEVVRYTQALSAAVATGNPKLVLFLLLNQQEGRQENMDRLMASVAIDWRVAMLTSGELSGEHLEMWFPEYIGRWEETFKNEDQSVATQVLSGSDGDEGVPK
jgi:hypothetical protein